MIKIPLNENHKINLFSDDHWDARDAQVVCRMLGFVKDAHNIATTNSKFGRVSTDFIMDDVMCDGTESHIAFCAHNVTENCDSTEAAGVMCGLNYDNITLVGGNSTNEGNVLVNGKPIR